MRLALLLSSALLLSACGHLNAPPPTVTPTLCSPVVAPPETPLRTFTFFELPMVTGNSSVDLMAGLTSDGVRAVLGNLSTLQKREIEWQGRAEAVNKCLADEAKQRGAKK